MQLNVPQEVTAQNPQTERRHRRLGRGLASLISIQPVAPVAGSPAPAAGAPAPDYGQPASPADAGPLELPGQRPGHAALANVPLAAIEPNPFQPRRAFDDDALRGLAESIRCNGLVQPVLLRRRRDVPPASVGGSQPAPAPGGAGPSPAAVAQYQLIAGERRWRAAKLAGLETIPAIIKPVDDAAALELALVENIQRADLNPIERANAYRAILATSGMTIESLARRLGESRSNIGNHLRLLELPGDVQDLIAAGQLSFAHGRAVLGLRAADHQRAMARTAVANAWSSRQVEEFVREVLMEGELSFDELLARATGDGAAVGGSLGKQVRKAAARPPKPANIVALEEQLTRRLGTRVFIRQGRRPDLGKVIIDYYSLDDFDRILDALGVTPD